MRCLTTLIQALRLARNFIQEMMMYSPRELYHNNLYLIKGIEKRCITTPIISLRE